jgi:small multidrug resistance pump
LAVIYASWSGLGVLSVALFSVIFYKQILNWQMILGIFFIIVGVTLVNIYKVES